MQTGEGTFYYRSGAVKFRGNLTSGLAEGKGSLYYQDGSIMFTGDWRRGEFSRGTLQSKGPIEEEIYKHRYISKYFLNALWRIFLLIIPEDGRILQDYG